MPIFTGTIFAWSPSFRKTTSIGFTFSFFLSPLAVFVPPAIADVAVLAGKLVWFPVKLVFALRAVSPFSVFLSFGVRVVTLTKGTVSVFVRERVSISAVTDMPGRKASFSWIRILTSNLVASWLLLVLVN